MVASSSTSWESVPSRFGGTYGTPFSPARSGIDGFRLRMTGHIKIGRWLPFRAEEVLSPREGFVWLSACSVEPDPIPWRKFWIRMTGVFYLTQISLSVGFALILIT